MPFHGMNTVLPPDRLPEGKYPFAQNVRAYLRDAIRPRAMQDSSIETLPGPVYNIRRLNDTTPAGPVAGFTLIGGAASNLYAGVVQVDTGFSGNPLAMVPFRPNASVQPWMYVGDSLKMDKVRSDGLTYKVGIKEPQTAPTTTAVPASDSISLIGAVTATYWGDSPHSGPTGNYIWKFRTGGGSGPIRASTAPNGVTTGNSLIFDQGAIGSQSVPMEWTQYNAYSGTVTTAVPGNSVGWVSGDDFTGLVAGDKIVINAVTYTIAAFPPPTNTALHVTVNPGTQIDVPYSAAQLGSAIPVFTPALESEGYSDFNMVVEATLYIPSPGNYTLNLQSKDEVIWGLGSSGSHTPTWPAPTGGQVKSIMGQTVTALNGYPLMPKTVTPDGQGQVDTGNIVVTFPAAGNYPIEIDYDFWYHSGRILVIKENGNFIPPIPASTITDAQYRYTYRSSVTGAVSNPSPSSAANALSVLSNTVTPVPSTDPQVDKIDFYRKDSGLLNFTYVGTGPNSATPFKDTLLDADVIANPVLEFDNFEPFPSIDLPRKGIVNVSGGVATWVSGDQFNVRWLPGTIIILGPTSPTASAVAYTLNTRPTSTTTLTATNEEIQNGVPVSIPLADGTGLTYEIAEPILAAQPMPFIWGPTDNVAFIYGCGDPLRPGVLYWTKGNNPDSAPDTNQQDVTSPSEPLVNGLIVDGLGWVASPERAWLIYPNFFNALATVDGTIGSTWTLQESSLKRGVYMPWALTVDGGHNVFFRAKDGIYISPYGQGGESITDADLFNIFPHEGALPQPVIRGGFVVYPPDDSKPASQRLSTGGGYLYYDYQDTLGTQRTLVFDIAGKGWVWDLYEHPVVTHTVEEGDNINGVLCGCTDGTVRPLADSTSENATCVVLMPCDTAGDVRSQKHWGDLYIEANPPDSIATQSSLLLESGLGSIELEDGSGVILL
jgi:hypothetical protein